MRGQLGPGGDAALEEARRRAATAAVHVPPGAALYRGLPEVEAEPREQARLPKQLHPGWVASRSARPELASLWCARDHQMQVCHTRGVAVYTPPTPAAVAACLLDLPR